MEDEKKVINEEEKEESKFSKFLNFVDDHKWEILGTIAGTAVGLIFLNRHFKAKERAKALEEESKELLKVFESSQQRNPLVMKIDEEIFTDLAPEIEEMVLNKGVEKGWISRTYKIGGGSKLVEVNVEKV